MLEQKYRCKNNCGKESMSYDEASQHLKTCTFSIRKTKIEWLLDQLDKGDQVVSWDDSSR